MYLGICQERMHFAIPFKSNLYSTCLCDIIIIVAESATGNRVHTVVRLRVGGLHSKKNGGVAYEESF